MNIEEANKKLKEEICDSLDPERMFMIEMEKENEHLKETGIPRCHKCKKNMINGIDSVTKQISKYIWIYDCSCHGKIVGQLMVV
jgi:hypothetical protein